jgi:hypothetical protein
MEKRSITRARLRDYFEGTHRAQLASASKVDAVEARAAVDDEKRETALGHHRACLEQKLLLVVRVVCPGVRDVVEDLLAREAKALGDRQNARRPEGALGVDVKALALASTHADGQLPGARLGPWGGSVC